MVKTASKAQHVKSQEGEIKAFGELSWVLEKYLSAVDEGYMKDLKETHDEPNEKFDMVYEALWIDSFTYEGKSTTIGESCR